MRSTNLNLSTVIIEHYRQHSHGVYFFLMGHSSLKTSRVQMKDLENAEKAHADFY